MPLDLSKDVAIRWESPDAAAASLCKQAGVVPVSEAEVRSLKLPDHDGGLWPGIARPPSVAGRGDETASASREPWVDANGYKVAWLRALHPERPAVLHYLPELGDRAVPFDTLELALIEAWVAGGNYILALEPQYKAALLKGDDKAVAAWKQLGTTVRWLREHMTLFRQQTVPIVTQLVDAGHDSAEISNLLYRRNVSPLLVANPTVPGKCLAFVAANVKRPGADVAKRVLAHAEAGATVVTAVNEPWWRVSALRTVKTVADRETFTLGKGRVVAYKGPIDDPSEFALDVIDVIAHRNRAVRMWNAPSVIGLVTSSPQPRERLLHMVNYGSRIDIDTQVRVQGSYTKATLMRPDGTPVSLRTAKRGTTTEVQVPELRRVGVVRFS